VCGTGEWLCECVSGCVMCVSGCVSVV
jgi:hypothetical protein